jgi:hypothetical protein
MTRLQSNDNNGGWFGPVVEIWVDDNDDGSQSVFITGERPDGQRFFGSFFQPTIDQEDSDVR